MFTLLKPRGRHRYYSVRITLPGAPTFERSTKCERRADARAVAERLHAEAAAAESREPLAGALDTLIGLRVRQRRAPATIEKLEQKAAHLIAYFGDERDARELRLIHTTGYVAHRRAQRVSDSTIAMELTVLVSAVRYLQKLERYDRDPRALWPDELQHGSGVRTRWLPWAEHARVLLAMPAEFRDHFVVYCATGLRFSELYSVRAVDLIATAEGHELRVRGTKTAGAVRTVPVNGDVLEALQRRAEFAPDGPLFPVKRADLKSQKAAWAKALGRACRAARVAHASTNDLRRTFASWAFQEGVAEALTIEWLGHESSRMVRRVYAHASSEQHAREGAKLPSRRATAGATAIRANANNGEQP